MKRSGTLLFAALVFLLPGGAHAQQKPAPNAAAAARAATDDLLRQLADAQKWAGEQIWHVKEGMDAVPGLVNELKDQNTARAEEVQKLRDEVKGLYVETSSLRQQLDELKGDIGGVNANVSAFRTFSGFFIAVMILLLAVIFVMSIRR
jgi:polyhydroxyalkanoate synthesis regulator phasin